LRGAKKRAPGNGFVSGWYSVQCSWRDGNSFAPKRSFARRGRRRAKARPYTCPENAEADRPAGTREALPGTICRVGALRFKRKGTRHGGRPYEEKWMAC